MTDRTGFDPELEHLVMAMLDETAAPEQIERLGELLRQNPVARTHYLQMMRLDALLADELASLPADAGQLLLHLRARSVLEPIDLNESLVLPALNVRDEPSAPFPRGQELLPLRRPNARSRHMLVWAAAAILLIAVGLATHFRVSSDGAGAVLASAENATWDGHAFANNAALVPGTELRLRSGLVKLHFARGTDVVLEGPATFQITGANAGKLTVGKVSAYVPPTARGFVVTAGKLVVNDLGTEFGLNLPPAGDAEMQVFKGAVSLSASGLASAPITLRQGDIVRCAPGGGSIRTVSAGDAQPPLRFVRAAPDAGALATRLGPGHTVGPELSHGDDAYDAATDTYTLTSSGGDIWGAADSFQFVPTELDGDFELVAKLEGQSGTAEWSKAGLIIRATSAPDSAFVTVLVSPRHGVMRYWRAVAGEDLTLLSKKRVVDVDPTPGPWLKLSRRGEVFSAFSGVDAVTWTPVGPPVTQPGPARVFAGLAYTAHRTAVPSAAKFSHVIVTPLVTAEAK